MQEELASLQKVYDVLAEFVVKYSFQILGALIVLVVGLKIANWSGRSIIRFLSHPLLPLSVPLLSAAALQSRDRFPTTAPACRLSCPVLSR